MSAPPLDRASIASRAGAVRWTVVLLCLTNVVSNIDRTALSILLPPIRAELSLSDTQLGMLTGLAFALFYAVAGIPIARLADRHSRHSIIAVSVAAWSLVTAATGAAVNFGQLLLARIGIAIGEAGAVPPAHSLLSDIFPPERRAGILALHSAAAPVGTLLGLAVGGWLATLIGWRWTFVAFGIPGLVLAALIVLKVEEPVRGRFDSEPSNQVTGLWPTLMVLWHKRSFLHLLIAFAIGTFVVTGLVQWLPSYFVRQFDLSTAQVGLYYGLAFGGGSVAGMVGGARMADRLISRDLRWSMWLACLSYAVVFPLYLFVLGAESFVIAVTLVALASALAGAAYGPVWASIQNIAPGSMRATATAIALFAANLIGGGLGPLAVGLLSDAAPFTDDAASLRFGLLMAVLVTPLPIYFFWASARHFSSDMAAAQGTR